MKLIFILIILTTDSTFFHSILTRERITTNASEWREKLLQKKRNTARCRREHDAIDRSNNTCVCVSSPRPSRGPLIIIEIIIISILHIHVCNS
jgi:hypothetical protein